MRWYVAVLRSRPREKQTVESRFVPPRGMDLVIAYRENAISVKKLLLSAPLQRSEVRPRTSWGLRVGGGDIRLEPAFSWPRH